MRQCVWRPAVLGSIGEVGNLVYRGQRVYPALSHPTRTTLRVWTVARRRFHHPDRWSPVTPSSGNPNLPHLCSIPDPQLWARYGIKTLRDVMEVGTLLSFAALSANFHLPGSITFRYFQMRHAIRAQFTSPPNLKVDPIEELQAQESLSKPLSALYFYLLSADSPRMTTLWDKWKNDIPNLDREDWKDCLGDSAKLLISSQDRLIQIKFIHRVYYTPQRLHHIYPQRHQNFIHCGGGVGAYRHMLWTCQRVASFWGEVIDTIHSHLQLNLPVNSELLLLGVNDDDQSPRCTKLLIFYLLYYTKRDCP